MLGWRKHNAPNITEFTLKNDKIGLLRLDIVKLSWHEN